MIMRYDLLTAASLERGCSKYSFQKPPSEEASEWNHSQDEDEDDALEEPEKALPGGSSCPMEYKIEDYKKACSVGIRQKFFPKRQVVSVTSKSRKRYKIAAACVKAIIFK